MPLNAKKLGPPQSLHAVILSEVSKRSYWRSVQRAQEAQPWWQGALQEEVGPTAVESKSERCQERRAWEEGSGGWSEELHEGLQGETGIPTTRCPGRALPICGAPGLGFQESQERIFVGAGATRNERSSHTETSRSAHACHPPKKIASAWACQPWTLPKPNSWGQGGGGLADNPARHEQPIQTVPFSQELDVTAENTQAGESSTGRSAFKTRASAKHAPKPTPKPAAKNKAKKD